ncbi:MAG: ferritin family protein [Armatimonadetes bacterium]|nr:ferritin family protein [Armatimonadota bacterium]MDE2206429.1 ferritin family protein [Armatimonadota bacterium]
MADSVKDLPPRKMLALAIAVETRNAQRYETFGHIFEQYNDEAAELFEDMKNEELAHRRALEELYQARFGGEIPAADEHDVDEVVEAVDIDDAETLIIDSMTRRDVLEAALRAEEGARAFYAELSTTVQDAALLELYGRLAAYEDDHVEALQSRLRALAAERQKN